MKVAFIGLGAMGLPMARRLTLSPGVRLSAFDVDRARHEMARDIGEVAESVASAIHRADVIMSVLPADDHVLKLTDEIERHGTSGQIYLDFSTIAPQTITAVSGRLSAVGIHTVGLGLLRGTPAAQAGTLVLYAGGLDRLRDRVYPLLEPMSSEVIDLGSPEAAKALKVANNMVVGCLDALIGEVVAIGAKAGLSAEAVTEALIAAGCDSWVLRYHTIPYVLTDDLGPGRFATRLMAKDMRLFGRMAETYGHPSRLAAVALSYYRGALAHGHALDYHPIVVRWLREGLNARDVVPDRSAFSAIVAATSWVQALVCHDALDVTTAAGLAPAVAAQRMHEGSGGNDSLSGMIASGHFSRDSLDARAAFQDLQAATDAADRLFAPALFFEMAKLDVAKVGAASPALSALE